MAKTEKVLFINNYSIIKSLGKILIISLLTYYVCIFGILGWSFHWVFYSYILLIINIIVLDRLLIAFHIDNKNSNDSFLFINSFWASKIYLIIRSVYVYGTIVYYSLSVLFYGIYGISAAIESNIVFMTPELFIEKYTKRKNNNSLFIHRSFLAREFDNIEAICYDSLGASTFCKDLLFKNKPGSRTVHIYSRKPLFFNKYLYSAYFNTEEYLHFSSDGDTLYIGKKSIKKPENYILKRTNSYIHTITRLNLKYELETNINYGSHPEFYTTESIEFN